VFDETLRAGCPLGALICGTNIAKRRGQHRATGCSGKRFAAAVHHKLQPVLARQPGDLAITKHGQRVAADQVLSCPSNSRAISIAGSYDLELSQGCLAERTPRIANRPYEQHH